MLVPGRADPARTFVTLMTEFLAGQLAPAGRRRRFDRVEVS